MDPIEGLLVGPLMPSLKRIPCPPLLRPTFHNILTVAQIETCMHANAGLPTINVNDSSNDGWLLNLAQYYS